MNDQKKDAKNRISETINITIPILRPIFTIKE
jgi:hypothetical protein